MSRVEIARKVLVKVLGFYQEIGELGPLVSDSGIDFSTVDLDGELDVIDLTWPWENTLRINYDIRGVSFYTDIKKDRFDSVLTDRKESWKIDIISAAIEKAAGEVDKEMEVLGRKLERLDKLRKIKEGL